MSVVIPVTSFTASLCAILLILLSLLVSFRRMKTQIEVGAGEDAILLKRIRAHGNFIEYAPIALILLAIAEIEGASMNRLWAVAGLLLGGRALHAVGMLGNIMPARGLGMLMTFGSMIIAMMLLPWR